jgi:hypothetical protein
MPTENGNQTNLTIDELAVIERAARKYAKDESDSALHRFSRNALAGFITLAIGLLLAVGLQQHDAQQSRDAVVTSGRTVSVVGCNRDYNTINALRSILVSSREQIDQYVQDGQITQAQADRQKKLTNEFLKTLPLPDCRSALTILTDNPNDLGRVPTPLYEKPKSAKKPSVPQKK